MAHERNASSVGLISRASFFCLFAVASTLFVLSWLFVLSSTGRPSFLDYSLIPSSRLFFTVESKDSNQGSTGPETSSQNPEVSTDSAEEGNRRSNAGGDKCEDASRGSVLRVYMYDLPPEYHFGLLGWKPKSGEIWPDIRSHIPGYAGGLNLQHSIEYWMTLDLLSSEFAPSLDGRNAVRVRNSTEADIIFVPYFSSLSYNRYSKVEPHEKSSKNKLLQEKLVRYLTSQREWVRSEGKDHIILAHHPNSMSDARTKLWTAMFILADFGRYPPNIANINKDIIAPYKHVVRNFDNDLSGFDDRPTLLYFQGAIYRKDVCLLPFDRVSVFLDSILLRKSA